MPKLKKGVSFAIGGRTFSKEITQVEAKIIKKQFGSDKLDKALEPEPKKAQEPKEEKPPKSK